MKKLLAIRRVDCADTVLVVFSKDILLTSSLKGGISKMAKTTPILILKAEL